MMGNLIRKLMARPAALPTLLSKSLAALLLLPPLIFAAAEPDSGHTGHGAATGETADRSGHGAPAADAPADHSGHGAQSTDEAADHSGHGTRAGGAQGVQVGLDERLGAKIPLDLVLRDESGASLRLGDLVTGPTIILPVYYRCTNVCNFLQGGLARVLQDLKPRPGEDYRVLSVSFDETEGPKDAAASRRMYMAALNHSFPADGWRFLTGDAATVGKLTDAAGYRFQRKGREFMHPVASFVVAGDGMIVRYLYGTSFLAKDLTLALAEAREGRSGATIRKMVSYCFTFDPNKKSYQFNLLRVSATVIILCTGGFFAYLALTGRAKGKGSGGK